ncbi:DNA polymerase III subunit tau [endosymbiont of Euscepes postfasciatus]|uniref:DNA polymerase III subunit gamma/tau n=1 Tax=endosymbiont of Euscepes postfasciatus TaxID=650377 RepID=UPI000DC732EC|nr:DNA polymerase III subunit gamma/tau [endosymbiont of Euscepes postfasciatus]BBA84602.1 DNA polymerase III subunit tau [endosymbiont of Euscepes postfasciatus]
MYDNLYTKWRPNTFNDIIGQKNIVKYFKNAIFFKKIHHSYIFTGYNGIGKTTIARLLVKSINCININELLIKSNNFPCNTCENCILINENKFYDYIEIDAAIKNSIDDIKLLLENIIYYPIKSKYKIYLIDEIHILSKQGFSALLKSLEEPPNYIKFILATNDIKKIPENILSRCIVLNFEKISICDIVKRLVFILDNENIKYTKKSLYNISIFSNGSIRNSLNILEQCILISNNNTINIDIVNKILNICDINLLLDIINSIVINNICLFNKCINYINKYTFNYNNIFINIINILHILFMLKIDKNYIINPILYSENDIKKILYISNNASIKNLNLFIKYLFKYNKYINYYFNEKIGFNLFFIRIFYIINN